MCSTHQCPVSRMLEVHLSISEAFGRSRAFGSHYAACLRRCKISLLLCSVDRLCPVYITQGSSWCEVAGLIAVARGRVVNGTWLQQPSCMMAEGTPGLQCHKAATREALRPDCGARAAAPRPTVPRAASATVQLLRRWPPHVFQRCENAILCASVPV